MKQFFFKCYLNLFLLIFLSAAYGLDGNKNGNQREMVVQGKCELREVADLGQITLTVENLEKDVMKASSKTTEQYNHLKKEIEKLKIADLVMSTSQYQVYEQKEWENNKNVSKGFKAVISLSLESKEIKKFSDIIRVSQSLAVTNVSNFTTSLSKEKLAQMEAKCLTDASKNALDKAQALTGLKIKVGKVLRVSEVDFNMSNPGPYPMVRESMAMMKMSSAAEPAPGPSMIAGLVDYQKTITVVFEIE